MKLVRKGIIFLSNKKDLCDKKNTHEVIGIFPCPNSSNSSNRIFALFISLLCTDLYFGKFFVNIF